MNNQVKRKREKWNKIIRWCLYFLVISIAYVFMSVTNSRIPDPILLIPIALCISMRETPFLSALTGCVCGLMTDSAMGTIVGFHGILLMWFCVLTSLLFIFIMRQHILNIILITTASTVILALLNYLFSYAIWGYDSNGKIFLEIFLPSILFTVISTAVIYYIIKFIAAKFGAINENFIEEKSDSIVRE